MPEPFASILMETYLLMVVLVALWWGVNRRVVNRRVVDGDRYKQELAEKQEVAEEQDVADEARANHLRLLTDTHQAVAAALEDAFAVLSAAGVAPDLMVELVEEAFQENRKPLTPAWEILHFPFGFDYRLLIGVDGKVYFTDRYDAERKTVWQSSHGHSPFGIRMGSIRGDAVGEIRSHAAFTIRTLRSDSKTYWMEMTRFQRSIYSQLDPEWIRRQVDRLRLHKP